MLAWSGITGTATRIELPVFGLRCILSWSLKPFFDRSVSRKPPGSNLMSRRAVLITRLFVVIGVMTSATPCIARVIHCGPISLEVPDTWRARDRSGAEEDSDSRALDVGDERLGSWEAFEAGESRGYLTAGVLNRSSPISPLGAPASHRELERRLHDLPCVDDVRVSEFDTIEIDGVPVYRARYTLATKEHRALDQSLYIVGGSETCFLAFTSATGADASSFDEIMQRARVHNRPLLLGVNREWSLAILAALAATSLLFHAARAAAKRSAAVRGQLEGEKIRARLSLVWLKADR